MFVQIRTDNHIKSDADANARLEERVRSKLRRFKGRVTGVEVHIGDANGPKRGQDKKVSIEVRVNGHEPVAVHADADRVDNAVALAADKAVRALDHALGKLQNH